MTALRDDDGRTGEPGPGLPPVAGTAADVMVRRPKTLPADATVRDVRAALTDGHVHMVLLVDRDEVRGTVLCGTVLRDDLTDLAPADAAALTVARLEGRTVAPEVSAEAVRSRLVATGHRRLAVVADTRRLLGLVCLKREQTGFCSDEGVANRAAGRPDAC
jgi:CBS domain-containing protein